MKYTIRDKEHGSKIPDALGDWLDEHTPGHKIDLVFEDKVVGSDKAPDVKEMHQFLHVILEFASDQQATLFRLSWADLLDCYPWEE